MMLAVGCDKDKVIAPVPQPPANAAEFVQAFAATYRAQDSAMFAAMLSDDFLFIFEQPDPVTVQRSSDASTRAADGGNLQVRIW